MTVGPARVVGHVLRTGRRSIIVQADVIDVGADRKLVSTSTLAYAARRLVPWPRTLVVVRRVRGVARKDAMVRGHGAS